MKNLIKVFAILASLILSAQSSYSQIRIGGKKLNIEKVVSAGKDAATAITLTDQQIAQLSAEAVAQMDATNQVAPDDSPYTERLNKLTEGAKNAGQHSFNYKVYLTDDINAFACGDGSIRVFSGLMDIMSDNQLMAIIGHEIGHVVNTDVKDAMKQAYMVSAARNAISSTDGKLASLTDSQLGDLVQSFTGAQFSQKQEYAADEYGFQFAVDRGYDPNSMAEALEKLVELSSGAKASAIQKMFSSHPDSEKRAVRMREKAK